MALHAERRFGRHPLFECRARRAVTLPVLENSRLGRKVNFARGKIPLVDKSHRKSVYSVPVQETAKHRAKFGWPSLSDVGALTKPRTETDWNLLGTCPRVVNRSQPLLYGPKFTKLWQHVTEISLFNKFFFQIVDMCLSCEDIAQQSCAIVRRWRIFWRFLLPVFSASHVQHTSDLRSKFALRPLATSCVEVW